jgi:hypothetical protein
VLNGAKREDPKIELMKKSIPPSQDTLDTDDVRIDETGVEDAEIIGDDEDLEQIKMNKARFELKKME